MAKILLAEDEVNIASFIERGLKEFGHSVTVCHDGNTGWRILQEDLRPCNPGYYHAENKRAENFAISIGRCSVTRHRSLC